MLSSFVSFLVHSDFFVELGEEKKRKKERKPSSEKATAERGGCITTERKLAR